MELIETFKRVKTASKALVLLSDDMRNDILNAVADAIIDYQERILAANEKDLAKMDPKNPLYDRLQLTTKRLADIASDMRNVASLPSPLGHVTKEKTLPNGLRLHRVSVPFGVIGMIYEARPNVTFDVFSLCFKSGNACVLKGGSDADLSNQASVELIHEVLERYGVNPDVVTLLPATHEATGEMLNAVGYIDLCIPRGGRRLIDFVRNTARIPVIETGAGVVNTYFDKDGDLEMGKAIINNAKTRRVSVCNALDCLLVHESRLGDLVELVKPLLDHKVTLYVDGPAYQLLEGQYPAILLQPVTEESYGTEFMDYKMAIRTVSSLEEAIEHIDRFGSGHSEAIITQNEEAARHFQQAVDAACVYWNAPTSFTDGAQFGLGAEIGISTQKLGPRGPMALEEITTYKWIIEGEGQVRRFKMRTFINVQDIGPLEKAMAEAFEIKNDRFKYQHLGKNKTLMMIFFNNSLRTRLSTQKAAMNLGMNVIVLDVNAGAWKLETERGVIMDGDKSEHLLEAIPVMGCYCDLIGVRSFAGLTDREYDYAETVLQQFIKYSGRPVFAMETATVHPLQAFADLITIEEYNPLRTSPRGGFLCGSHSPSGEQERGRCKVVLTWAPHCRALPQAVPNSFAQWMNAADVDFVITHPKGYELDPKFVGNARVEYDQKKAFEGADFIYAKNWSNPGVTNPADYGKITCEDRSWTVDTEHMSWTNNGKFMHCLPVRRNLIVTDDVIESPNSLVIPEAANREISCSVVIKRMLEAL